MGAGDTGIDKSIGPEGKVDIKLYNVDCKRLCTSDLAHNVLEGTKET